MELEVLEARLFTLDGAEWDPERGFEPDGAPEPVTMEEFLRTNDLDEDEVHELLALEPGDTMLFGGGAQATFVLARVA